MSTMMIQSETLTDIADSIRSKLGVQDTYLPSEMPDAIESISGGGGQPVKSPVDYNTPLFVLFQHNPPDSVYTADKAMRVLVMNTMIIHEAGTTHSSSSTTTTTGTVVKSLLLETNYGDDYNRDSTTLVSLIDLEVGDTVTMSNDSRTLYVSKLRLIWQADGVLDIENILYDTVVDKSAYNTREFVFNNNDTYLVYLEQVSGANDSLFANISITKGAILDSYTATSTNNRISGIICNNPSDIICNTANVGNYTSKIFEILKLTTDGGGLGTKTITENGVYNAIDDNLNGYSSVTVEVEGGGTVVNDAVRVWTKDTTAVSASLYVQHGVYDGDVFTGTETVSVLNFGDASDIDVDYYNLISIRFDTTNNQWICNSIADNIIVGDTIYNTGDEIDYWTYSSNEDIVAYSHANSLILYGANAPTSGIGINGDYYYQRIIATDVCVPYWDNRQNSNTSTSGYEFITAQECTVVGVRVYNRGSAHSVTAGIYEEDGTVVETVTQTVGSGWSQLFFEHKHVLQNNTKYLSIANWGESGHAVYRSTYSIATDSRIVSSSLKGRYDSIPGSVDNDNVYGCDVLLESADSTYVVESQYRKSNNTWNAITLPTAMSSFGIKTITENGTYTASTDNVDGYSEVTVNVGGSNGFIPYSSRLYGGWYVSSNQSFQYDSADLHCVVMSWQVKSGNDYILMSGNSVGNRGRYGFHQNDLLVNPVESQLTNYAEYIANGSSIARSPVFTAPMDGYLIGYIDNTFNSPDSGHIVYLLDVTGQDLSGVIQL